MALKLIRKMEMYSKPLIYNIWKRQKYKHVTSSWKLEHQFSCWNCSNSPHEHTCNNLATYVCLFLDNCLFWGRFCFRLLQNAFILIFQTVPGTYTKFIQLADAQMRSAMVFYSRITNNMASVSDSKHQHYIFCLSNNFCLFFDPLLHIQLCWPLVSPKMPCSGAWS